MCRTWHKARSPRATFGAAYSLLLPIGVPFLLGRADLILPMLAGAALSMLLDGFMLYRMFDSRLFPATGTWPPDIAAAEAIRAGDSGGKRAALLGLGLLVGLAGSWLKIPMSAFGVAFIGNVWALTMFASDCWCAGRRRRRRGSTSPSCTCRTGSWSGPELSRLSRWAC
jgi:uncharacterized oligopeptide transporter (OPT) family protein